MLLYVEGNIDFVMDYCKKYLPAVKPLRPQASFLIWLDCRALKLNHDRLLHLFVNKARLALNDGEMFGPGGEGFMRMNVGTPRAVLRQAREQLPASGRGIMNTFYISRKRWILQENWTMWTYRCSAHYRRMPG